MRISRSIPIYFKFVPIGGSADLFHSFAAAGREVICAFRRHRIVDFREWGNGDTFYESRIMLQHFDIATSMPTSEPEEVMSVGEDPRCVSVGGGVFILSANPPGEHFNCVLYDLQASRRLNIEVTNYKDFKYGKNWQPFAAGEQLYAVHGFSPFRILRIDVHTGKPEVIFEKNVGLDVLSPHDTFRGGCSALVRGNEIVGFGHLTVDSGRHSLLVGIRSCKPDGAACV